MSDQGPVFRHEGDGREPGAEHELPQEDPEPIEVGAHVAELDAVELARLGRHLHARDVGRQLGQHRRGEDRRR